MESYASPSESTCIIKKSFLSMEFEKRMIQVLQKRGSTVVPIRLSFDTKMESQGCIC